ncbi:hypothetical protein ACWD6P_13115 [Streptomyces sp. NPDC002446]
MAVLVHHEGADWSQALYQMTFDLVVPDRTNPPAGLIAHVAAPGRTTGWQVIEVWQSEEQFRRFLEQSVHPAAQELGAPPFDSTVAEVYNSLIP